MSEIFWINQTKKDGKTLKFEVYLKLNIPEHSCLRWWYLSLFELHEAEEADFLT